MTAYRAALAAFCADRRVKLVHVWQTLDRWQAMVEWPYEPGRKVPTERHATGVGDSQAAAVIAGLDRIGYGQLETRLFVLAYMMGLK